MRRPLRTTKLFIGLALVALMMMVSVAFGFGASGAQVAEASDPEFYSSPPAVVQPIKGGLQSLGVLWTGFD